MIVSASLLALSVLIQNDSLRKPVTFGEGCAPLSEVVATLSKQTGVPIRVEYRFADRCLTLYCQKRPATEVMRMVADCLMATWKLENGVYRLEQTGQSRGHEAQAWAADEAAARENVGRAVAALVALGKGTPLTLGRQYLDAQAEESRLAASGRSAADPDLRHVRRRVDVLGLRDYIFFGQGIASAVEPVTRSLQSGGTSFASTRPQDRARAFPLPAHLAEGQAHFLANVTTSLKSVRVVEMIRVDPAGERFEATSLTTGLGNVAGLAVTRIPLESFGGHEARRPYAIEADLAEWAKKSDPDVLALKLPLAGGNLPEPGYLQGAWAVADHLRFLVQNTGVCVVADAYRTPCSLGRVFATTVGDYLREMNVERKTALSFEPGYVRSENGWLMYRHARSWNLARTMPPEPPMRTLDAKFQRVGKVSIGDYADLVSSLSEAQRRTFQSSRPILTRFPTGILRQAMPLLRLWGSLDEAERTQARSTPGLWVAAMDKTQTALYQECLDDAVWHVRFKESLLDDLLSGWPSRTRMRLFSRGYDYGPRNYEDESLANTKVVSSVLFRSGFSLGEDEENAIDLRFTVDP